MRALTSCGLWPIAAVIAVCALHADCAKVVSPGGGPEDRSTPRVVSLSPDSGSVWARPETLSIRFSKPMDRRSVRDWLFVTPRVAVAESRWRRASLDLILGSPPDTGRTYTILLGSEVVDRRGNALGPYATAFSTGSRLDGGTIEGSIIGRRIKPAGVYLYVWLWDDSVAASGEIPEPVRMGQCDREGRFRIPFLPAGVPLRVCAHHDARRDRVFDPEEDIWGCSEESVLLCDSSLVRTGLEIYLVWPEEPGSLAGSAIDSSCIGRGAEALAGLQKERDSLAVLLGLRNGEAGASNDSLRGFRPDVGRDLDTASVRARFDGMPAMIVEARLDSARCAMPLIVRLVDPDSGLVAEVRGDGAFSFRDLAPGTYHLRAFRDLDADGVPDSGEASGEFPFPIELLPGRNQTGVDFPLRPRP